VLIAHSGQGFPESISASRKALPLFLRHLGFHDLHDAFPPDYARQGKRDSVLWIKGTDRNHRALIPQHHLRNASRDHADPELAGLVSLDDGDIGIPHFMFDGLAQFLVVQTVLSQGVKNRHSRHSRRRPQQYFRGPMLAHNLSFHGRRVYIQVSRKVKTKS